MQISYLSFMYLKSPMSVKYMCEVKVKEAIHGNMVHMGSNFIFVGS